MKNRFLKKTIAAAVVSGLFTLSQTALAAEDAFVAQAKQTVAAATSPQTVWDGPTTGPKLQKGKSVIFIASSRFFACRFRLTESEFTLIANGRNLDSCLNIFFSIGV